MIYAVAIKDTLDDGDWKPNVKAIEKLRSLYEKQPDTTILIHDPCANNDIGLRMLTSWLFEHNVPYTDVWQGFGKPVADVYIDNRSCQWKL